MSKKAVVFVAPGFEEIEAVTIIDVLRRADILTVVVGVDNDKTNIVQGAHGIGIEIDAPIEEMEITGVDIAICPGGMPGSVHLADSEGVRDYLNGVYKNGGIAAAICAAPIVLDAAGLLKNRAYTCYPGMEDEIVLGTFTGKAVEVDGRVITGSGPGTAMKFALKLVEELQLKEKAQEVQKGMLYGTPL
ncbi:MAG: DJ-1 family glyoxalase III [Lentisphaeria bacterium]